MLFRPYDAEQLQDILRQRAKEGLNLGPLALIELCAALAAQEHGDARCALDLLRISAEKAERRESIVNQNHVRVARELIESDQMTPVIVTLPSQQKLVLASATEQNGLRNVRIGQGTTFTAKLANTFKPTNDEFRPHLKP